MMRSNKETIDPVTLVVVVAVLVLLQFPPIATCSWFNLLGTLRSIRGLMQNLEADFGIPFRIASFVFETTRAREQTEKEAISHSRMLNAKSAVSLHSRAAEQHDRAAAGRLSRCAVLPLHVRTMTAGLESSTSSAKDMKEFGHTLCLGH